MKKYILSIDAGTTSSRALIFDNSGKEIGKVQYEFEQYFPNEGWVEHNAMEIWRSQKLAIQQVLSSTGIGINEIASIGITNQRETTVVWDKKTGEPVYNAIVWQDRRTAEFCNELKSQGAEPMISEKTGLLLDPYFSGSKIHWILENIPGVKLSANEGELLFGTIDTWLIWKLTNGEYHITDSSNASRTMLFDIHQNKWDDDLIELLKIPKTMLPEIVSSSGFSAEAKLEDWESSIPIYGIAGDQQAALFGQLCFEAGDVKNTYGTGCFVLINTDENKTKSKNKLLTTIASKVDDKKQYAVEGSIFNAGTVVQWLRDEMKLFKDVSEIESLIQNSKNDITFIPAFTGLGAPYWKSDTRGTIYGITRDTSKGDIVKAALKSICFQTKDLLESLKLDLGDEIQEDMTMRVDGGMSNNNWMMQFLADILNIKVERPTNHETTVMGAAYLAGLKVGFFSNLRDIEDLWKSDRIFTPNMDEEDRHAMYSNWKKIVNNLIGL